MAYYRTIECSCGCAVDSDFGNFDKFSKVEKAGMLICSICGSSDVTALMPTPNTQTSEQRERADTVMYKGKPAEFAGGRFYEAVTDMIEGRRPSRSVIGHPSEEQVQELRSRGETINELPIPQTTKPRTYDA